MVHGYYDFCVSGSLMFKLFVLVIEILPRCATSLPSTLSPPDLRASSQAPLSKGRLVQAVSETVYRDYTSCCMGNAIKVNCRNE